MAISKIKYQAIYGEDDSIQGDIQLIGLDAEKPESAPNGTCYIAMDTSKIYFYDADNSQWRKWGA